MRNNIVLFLFACLCIFIGCLGGGGGGGGLSIGNPTSPIPASAVIYGKAFFPRSSLYGSIPIIAKDANGLAMGSTRTDSYGNYSFSELAPGVYNLFANTGDTEVQFFTGAQVIPGSPVAVPEKELVELENVIVDRINSTSFRVSFTSSQNCSSQVEYGPSVGPEESVSVNNSFVRDHQVTISSLVPDTRYGVKIRLMTQDGQQFSYPAIFVKTTLANGPTNLGFNIENGDMLTGFSSVRLYFTADNATEMRIGTTESLDGQAWEGFANFREYNLPSGDGSKRIYVQFRDSFGNVSSVINDSIHLQSDRTGYIGVWINNGQGLTNDRNVVLSMLFPGATHMQISDKADFLNSFWEAYAVARKYELSQDDGIKTVYVRFRGGQADETKTFSAAIVLDTTGPEVTMKINNGALKTNNINLTLNFNPVQTPAYMQIEEDGTFDADSTWIKFSNPANFLISKGDELKTVYARFKDELGNLFGPISAQIELDTTPPQNPDFSINNGDTTVDTLEVRLYISADDANYIIVSNNENFTGAVVERYKTIKNWSLAGYGVQSVYMQFVDDASNTTSALIQSIEVVGDPPASVSVAINQKDPSTENATVSITLFAENVVRVRVGNHQNFSSLPDITYVANQPDGSMKIDNFALDPVLGEKTVYARFEETTGRFVVTNDSISLVGPSNYTITSLDTQPLSTYTVNLRLYAENATQMLIVEDFLGLKEESNWRGFASNYALPLARYPGKHTVYAKFRNDGHVETPPISLDVTVNETSPASPAILINDGDAQTFSSNVRVKVISNFLYPTLRLSNDGNFFSASDFNSEDQNWVIPSKAGQTTVFARFLHKDTGEFFFTQDTITAVGPTNTSITTAESLPLNKNWLTLKLFAVNASEMMISEDPAIEHLSSGWVPYQTSYNFALSNPLGNHTIYAKFRNSSSNFIESVPVQLNVTVVADSPSGNSVTIRESIAPDSTAVTRGYPSELPVYLHFDIQDTNTATISYQIASAGMPLPTSFRQITAPGSPIPLNYSDFNAVGVFNIYYKFSTGAGKESDLQVVAFEVLEVPPNSSISINGGDPSTQSPSVSLRMLSNNAVRYRISADGNFNSIPDSIYVAGPDGSMTINNYPLEPISGVKSLYARFESNTGQITYASDSISLIGPENYTLSTNDVQPLTTYQVTLLPFAENATQMLITEDFSSLNNPALWQTFAYSLNFTLSPFAGKHTVYAKFRNAGNVETPVVSLDVTVVEIAPASPSIMINDGDAVANNRNVTLKVISSGDFTRVRFSNDQSFVSATEYDIVDQNWVIPPQAGETTVYARFLNPGTGEFFYAQDSITAIGPTGATISTSETMPLNKNFVNLDLFAVNATQMLISEDPAIEFIDTGWVPYQATFSNFALSDTAGDHSIYAKFRNAGGIESVPVKLDVTVVSSTPTGNTVAIRETISPSSAQVSEAYVNELPVYLHFDIQDASTATISYQIVSSGMPLPTTFNELTAPGAPVSLNYASFNATGVFNIYYKFANGAGDETALKVVTFEVLELPPNSTFSINGGDATTQIASVTLRLFSNNVRYYRISSTGNFNSIADTVYVAGPDGSMTIASYPLEPVSGVKNLYARYESNSGQLTYASDSITLVGPENYSLTTNDTQPLSSFSVNLRPFAENASEMLITEDYQSLNNSSLWQPFVYSLNFPLSPFSGQHTIYAKFRNNGKVETPTISLNVTVGESVADTPSFVINLGDSQTNRSNVTLDISGATDYPTMRISNDGNFFNATNTASVDQPWYLTSQAGEKTVYIRFQHGTTGAFVTASDSITAVGPTNAAISTLDSQPMNKNWVNLDLFAVGATHMIATENADIANLKTNWIPYQTQYPYQLTDRVGDHTIYAKFRNAATNYIETVPVSLQVTVNSTSPSGNTAAIRESAAVGSTVVSEVAVGSLPVYLHFDIQDANTATISWKIASAGASIPTTFNQVSAPVAPIPLNTGDFPGNGTFNIYYKFADGVGNETSLQILSIKVLGPSLKISPVTVAPLTSGKTQQFSATLENVEGTVRWFITPSTPASVTGTIGNTTGLYSAPSTVYQNASITVRAELLSDSSVYDEVSLELVTQVEIVVAQTNYQITKGNSTNIAVRFRNSTQTGSVVSPTTGGGSAVITAGVAAGSDFIATLTYTAPGTALSDSVEITSLQDPSKKKILYFTVNDGPWVTVTPESGQMRVKTGSLQFAANTSSDSATLYWALPKGGWFDAAKTLTTTTTPGNGSHLVTVYAPDTQAVNPIEIVASFTEGADIPEDRSPITLQSEVKVTVTPKNQKLYLNDTESLLFLAELTNATTSEVIWEFKNASESVWVRADNYVNENNGILTLNQGSGEYSAPASWPVSGVTPVSKINIRATSIDDTSASETITVELLQPLGVTIYDGYNNTGTNITNSSISVTLEVGNRQLFAEVGPVTDPTTNTTVNWFVQGVAGGNTTYGTIDTTGRFTAPDTAPQAAVTVRAVSVAQPTALAETTINLLDFWTPRSSGLNNATTATDSVFCLKIDPTSAAGDPRVIYCGTNGFGVFRTTIAPLGSSYNWDSVTWTGVNTLWTNQIGQGAKYIVNQLAISNQDSDRVVAATNDGLYLITGAGTIVQTITVPGVRNANVVGIATATTYSGTFTNVFSSVVIDPTDHTYMYAVGRDQGVLRFIWDGISNYVYDGTLYDDNQAYSVIEFYDWDWSANTGSLATPTWETGTLQRPRMVLTGSGTMEFNCAAMTAQNPNVLFVGFTKYLDSRNPDVFKPGYIKIADIRSAEFLTIGQASFNVGGTPGPGGAVQYNPAGYTGGFPAGNPESINNWRYVGVSGIIYWDTGGIIQSIAIDPNTASTIWLGKNSGIERSTDDGDTFSSLGAYANVRDIFIDPINTVNVYIGTEAGLYRTKDAGASWKQIKSGLEGNTTLNALGLTPGGLGKRRIFLGTTSGTFMGRTSLDLD